MFLAKRNFTLSVTKIKTSGTKQNNGREKIAVKNQNTRGTNTTIRETKIHIVKQTIVGIE